jgi:Ca2+-binding RTX toxin-like protein
MSGNVVGGNDTFIAAGNSLNTFYGDAGGNMSGYARGGNDTFVGSQAFTIRDLAYGDALTMSGNAMGGDDTLIGGTVTGGTNQDTLIGDAQSMSDKTQGGNDTLIAGNSLSASPAWTFNNLLIGDAQTMSGNAHGGNDTLISGTGNDDMWGDAQFLLRFARGGNDTFVFNFNNGHDMIEDFGQGVHGMTGSNWGTDHIDVSAMGITDFHELNISAFDPATHESTITFAPGEDVVVRSQVALSAHDFLLV